MNNSDKQYALSCFARSLNEYSARDAALDTAKEMYYLGHNKEYVRTLIKAARKHQHAAMRLKRGAQ